MSGTIVEKILAEHTIATEGESALLFVDRHIFHEGSFHAFARLRERDLPVARPDLTFGVADHYAPTHAGDRPEETRKPRELFTRNVAEFGVNGFDLGDRLQGIAHVVGPEQGLTAPGMTVVGGDSHTTTHGALGALAVGIGASQVLHVFATQTLWLERPRTMLVEIEGSLSPFVSGKDVALRVLARLGVAGGLGHAIEFSGSLVDSLPMAERFTLCNLVVEGGGRSGIISPDETTIEYAASRPRAPRGEELERAIDHWRRLASDPDAVHDRVLRLDAGGLAPQVTWGTTADTAVSVDGWVPDPSEFGDAADREEAETALEYMDLAPGTALAEVAVDRVFIGSCANGRIEDLRAAAAVARHGRAAVPTMVSPGSTRVKELAEEEGLDQVFIEAGFEWVESGCSLCVAINGDRVGSGERCVSTTNRNFPGRQGPGARTHLASPATAAATALRGHIADPRDHG